MDPFDELAQSIIIAYQSPVNTATFIEVSGLWSSSTDSQRRTMVRDWLYERSEKAETWVNHLVVTAEAKRVAKEAKAAAAADEREAPEAKGTAAIPNVAAADVAAAATKVAVEVSRVAVPEAEAEVAAAIARVNPSLAGLPDFFNQLGRDAVARIEEQPSTDPPGGLRALYRKARGYYRSAAGFIRGWPPPDSEARRLPDWAYGRSSGQIAIDCAKCPGRAAELADALEIAVPFSIVWARELEQITKSREERHRIDPEVWLRELHGLKSRWENKREELQKCKEREENSGTATAAPPGFPDEEASIDLRLVHVCNELKPAGVLREAWDSLRVEEEEHLEWLADPSRRKGDIRARSEKLRDQRLQREMEATDARSKFYLTCPGGTQAPDGEDKRVITTERTAGNTPGTSPTRRAENMQLLGLAFSGGGIRSATFNLGVLQALAELGMLKFVDYLSTVSGGGYIGSWFTAWCSRIPGGVRAVEPMLSPLDHIDPTAPKLAPLAWLREFSNYLAPESGFFSADTWTINSTWLRNTILNQLVVVTLLAGILAIPYALVQIVALNANPGVLAALAAALLFAAVRVIAVNLRTLMPERRFRDDPFANQGGILTLVIAPVTAAGFLFVTALWWYLGRDGASTVTAAGMACVGMVLVSLGLALTYRCSFYDSAGHRQRKFRHEGWAVFSSILCGLIASTVAALLFFEMAEFMRTYERGRGDWAVVAFAPSAGITIFSVAIVVQIGLLGRRLPDDRREWWSRVGAWLMLSALGWAALCGIGVYGPLWVALAGAKLKAAGGIAWAVTTIGGLLAGKSADTDGAGKKSFKAQLKEAVAVVAPYVFVAGLLVLISYGLFRSVMRDLPPTPPGVGWTSVQFESLSYWANLRWIATHPWLAAVPFVLVIIAFVLAWRIDVNEFSLHHFYKNRLVRCYLGASRRHRRPNLFTGFDSDDDVKLCSLQLPDTVHAGDLKDKDPRNSFARTFSPYSGPYPIVNTALNTSKGERLAWQERKAESFIFTPCYAGFACDEKVNRQESGDHIAPHAYRPTERFGYGDEYGAGLGTAVAISGAAVNPNMGYHTSPAVSFLLTIFNVRLGWWFGNPRHREKHRLSSPKVGLLYLVTELTGSANSSTGFVNLSDGGHFENLGVYELIRRRCRCIIVGDAEEDAALTFGALGGVIRKCRIDFNVDIEIVLDRIVRLPGEERSVAHCVVADINYPADVNNPVPFAGKLIYLKSSITGDEPSDIREYNWRAEEFPHQTTGDQFFDESQFESYRALGYHIAKTALSQGATGKDFRDKAALEAFLEEITSEWLPPTAAMQKSFLHSTSYYRDALEAIRNSANLQGLGKELFGKPTVADAEYLYLLGIIQAMENVFLDLELEKYHKHPLNSGWMEVFKQWADSPRLRSVWKTNRQTFSTRFAMFCDGTLRMNR